MWTLLACLFRKRVPSLPAEPVDAAPGDDGPRGCGWFDSSHELRAGLDVTEHAPGDAGAAALPLDDWLRLQLAGWEPRLS